MALLGVSCLPSVPTEASLGVYTTEETFGADRAGTKPSNAPQSRTPNLLGTKTSEVGRARPVHAKNPRGSFFGRRTRRCGGSFLRSHAHRANRRGITSIRHCLPGKKSSACKISSTCSSLNHAVRNTQTCGRPSFLWECSCSKP